MTGGFRLERRSPRREHAGDDFAKVQIAELSAPASRTSPRLRSRGRTFPGTLQSDPGPGAGGARRRSPRLFGLLPCGWGNAIAPNGIAAGDRSIGGSSFGGRAVADRDPGRRRALADGVRHWQCVAALVSSALGSRRPHRCGPAARELVSGCDRERHHRRGGRARADARRACPCPPGRLGPAHARCRGRGASSAGD